MTSTRDPKNPKLVIQDESEPIRKVAFSSTAGAITTVLMWVYGAFQSANPTFLPVMPTGMESTLTTLIMALVAYQTKSRATD